MQLTAHLDALISLTPVKHGSADEITELIDRTDEAIQELKDLELRVEHFDIWFVHCVSGKLDDKTREDWVISEEKSETQFDTYDSLGKFLEKRVKGTDTP